MKTLMVLGVHEEGHPFGRVIRKEPYSIVAGAENRALAVRPSDEQVYMESGNAQDVLRVARHYSVDGILGVGDEASLTASYAAQQLGLPGIPYAEEQLFHNLLRLRAFQEQHGLRVPRYRDLSHTLDTGDLPYPMVVSPADGHVLRHCVRVDGPGDLQAARQNALRHSPCGEVIAQEELTQTQEPEGVFVMTDLVIRGGVLQTLLWCEALPAPGPGDYMPIGARYPARIHENTQMVLAGECGRLVALLGLQDAQIPVLAYCIPGSVPYLLRIGVRDGSYLLTRLLSHLYRHDLLQDALRIAAGDHVQACRYDAPQPGTCRAYYSIPVPRTGILRHMAFDRDLRRYRTGYIRRMRQSQMVCEEREQGQTLGAVMLRFPDEHTMDDVLGRMASLVAVEIDALDH